MADHTKIQWTDATVNFWHGCQKVSDGCKFCYAEKLSGWIHHKHQQEHGKLWGPNHGIIDYTESALKLLAKLERRAEKKGRKLKVFINSMSDTFEGGDEQ